MVSTAYLKLFRAPSAFTAMSNLYAGYLIGGGLFWSLDLLVGLVASSCFIMGGMALNDVADAEVDAAERPERPIPSGAISLGQAKRVGWGLLAAGFLLAAWVHWLAGIAALLLCGCIALYNFKLKSGPMGPAAMGLCRVLNFLLGLFLALAAAEGISQGQFLWPALSLFIYIYLITFIARDEVQGNSSQQKMFFLVGLAGWTVLWIAGLLIEVEGIHAHTGVLALAACAVLSWGALSRFFKNPGPGETQKVVMVLLGGIPLVDVLVLLYNHVNLVLCLLPLVFMGLSRWTGKKIYTT